MPGIKVNSSEPIYTLGVAAKLSNIPQHSIRQYIDKGLIIPFKTKTNRHLFSEIDILRLNNISKQINEKGLNIAGIKALYAVVPCWKIKPCSTDDRANCNAFHSSRYPCWEATEKGPKCKNSDCRTCDVYQLLQKYEDVKDLFRSICR